jgi:sugar lactone lactonase YvrE
VKRRVIAAAASALLSAAACSLLSNDRETTFADGRVFPESVTSTANGDLYFGSLGRDSVYKAAANTAQATTWIQPKANGLSTVLGVLADEPAGVLWVCASASGGQNGAPYVGETALKAFDLKDASFKASYPFPGNGLCNDIAVAKDGTVYATDTFEARVLRLKKGATALDVWAADPMLLAGADGIAVLGDGHVYVNSVTQNTLLRIPVNADGSAGAIVKLDTSRPLVRPDGMRTIGDKTMLLVEGEGRLDEVVIAGNRAETKVLRSGLKGPTAVTLAGGTAWVTEAKLGLRDDPSKDPGPFRAVGVPYNPAK